MTSTHGASLGEIQAEGCQCLPGKWSSTAVRASMPARQAMVFVGALTWARPSAVAQADGAATLPRTPVSAARAFPTENSAAVSTTHHTATRPLRVLHIAGANVTS